MNAFAGCFRNVSSFRLSTVIPFAPSEEQWEEVPWRPNLAVAIEEARETDASLEESVGEFWFRKCAEIVIECGFVGFLGAKTVRFSGDQF